MNNLNLMVKRCLSTTTKLSRWHKDKLRNPHLTRYGYEDKTRISGLLPRIGNDDKYRYVNQPVYEPRFNWSQSRALFGQNDYIDILGSDELHPINVQYGIPEWLRGHSGTYLQTMIKKKEMLSSSAFAHVRPKAWEQLNTNLHRKYITNLRALNQRRYTNYKGVKWNEAVDNFRTRKPF